MDIEERERLGKLFPIIVAPYDPRWPQVYEMEAGLIMSGPGSEAIVRVEHFGSTAVPGLAAKPVIDILIELTSYQAAELKLIPGLEKRGYHYQWVSEPSPGHMALWGGYFPEHAQKYHIHMAPGDDPLMDRLLFRDYLRENPETARRYEELKYRLAEAHHYDREAYTDAKADFVREITERAKG